MWAENFDKCVACGKDEFPHKSNGLCERCWNIHLPQKNKVDVSNPSINESIILTKEFLKKEYLENNKSVSEIARETGCTRMLIRITLKEYGIYRQTETEPDEGKSIPKGYLKKEYFKNNISISDIAKENNCSKQHIYKKLAEYKLYQENISNPENNTKTIVKKWAHDFDKCVSCGKNDIPHASKGLCKKCYEKYLYRKHNPHMYLPRENKTIQLTKEYLVNEYINNKKSIGDIAKEYKCTSQYIQKKLVKFGIIIRSKRDARLLAIEKKKVSYLRVDKDGKTKKIIPIKSDVDDYFFSYWSAPMAWVLGFIYADGNIYSKRTIGKDSKIQEFVETRVSMTQKEPEILEKIKVLLKSNQQLMFSKKRIFKNTVAGEIYKLEIRNIQIYSDLIKLGLTPNKSLTMEFPDVPKEYLWHFIRGCWDGDGSIYIEKKTQSIHADYVSGSKIFMEKLIEILKRELSIENISLFHRENSCYIKLHTKNCVKLCQHFYDGVSPDLYLSRKYNVYMHYLEKSMSNEKYRVSKKYRDQLIEEEWEK